MGQVTLTYGSEFMQRISHDVCILLSNHLFTFCIETSAISFVVLPVNEVSLLSLLIYLNIIMNCYEVLFFCICFM